jgi:hypothetical protein
MKSFIIVITLGVGLVAGGGIAAAQETADGAVINADGSDVTSTAGVNPVAEAEGPTIIYGDLNSGPGNTVVNLPADNAAPVSTGAVPVSGTGENISATSGDASVLGPGSASAAPGSVTGGSSGTDLLGPDGTYSVSDSPPSNVSVGDAAPAPVAETAPVEAAPVEAAPVETAPVDPAVADSDADNLTDSLETNYGLDAYNPDSDADGVADGDEINIYGTDPYYGDSDGDGILDGEELFGIQTDPLVWDDINALSGGGETAVS